MDGLNLKQFRDYIVVPALDHIGLNSNAAVQLVCGTALTESLLKYVDQVDKLNNPGPAYGLFQMERATHDDIWDSYLTYKEDLARKVRSLMILSMDACLQMHGNHFYAAAMCRVHYLRIKAPLPKEDDVEEMAGYWKRYYNSNLGKGKPQDFITKSAPVFLL